MIETDLLIIGGGPAGMNAALEGAQYGVDIVIADRFPNLGGQLPKQTHKFFGWATEGAGQRGFQLAKKWASEVSSMENIKVMTSTEIVGRYDDGSWMAYDLENQKLRLVKPKKVIVATGAQEKILPMENADLPGVYGAGAIQTMLHVHGVLPGERFLIVGAGNIGVILAYQLKQAGADVLAVIDILPKLGGAYWVHVSKIRRMGIPLYMSHTLTQIHGEEYVTGATIAQIDKDFKPIPGTEKYLPVDTIAISIGLSPLVDILYQNNVEVVWIPELGGLVPLHSENMRTTNPDIYVAGDVSGIEEATTAALEGRIAALSALEDLGIPIDQKQRDLYMEKLRQLRSAPLLEKLRRGIEKMHTLARERGLI